MRRVFGPIIAPTEQSSYPYDFRAYVQIDGRAITLPRRLTLSGTRYSRGDVTLKLTHAGATTIRHAKRREAVCALY